MLFLIIYPLLDLISIKYIRIVIVIRGDDHGDGDIRGPRMWEPMRGPSHATHHQDCNITTM